jgi:hypothetical protein
MGPVSDWSRSILVEGTLPGAAVTVCEDAPGGRRVVDAVASGGTSRLDLLPGEIFTPGARLFAHQELGETSGWTQAGLAIIVSTHPSDYLQTAPLSFKTVPHPCGGAVWVAGAVPGADVQVRSQSGTLLGSGIATEGDARLRLTTAIPPSTSSITAVQSAPVGTLPVSGAAPVATEQVVPLPVARGGELPQVRVGDPKPAGCDPSIFISGVVDGARVTVDRRSEGITSSAHFDLGELTMLLGTALDAGGGELAITQEVGPFCEVSASRPLELDFAPASTPAQPRPAPPCGGTTALHVDDIRPGAAIEISVDGVIYRAHAALTGTTQDFELGEMPEGGRVTVVQSACGLASVPGTTIVGPNVAAGVPRVVDPLYGCARVVRITDVTPGSYVRLLARGPAGESHISALLRCDGDTIQVPVTPYLVTGDEVRAQVTACGSRVAESDPVFVEPTPEIQPVQIGECFGLQSSVTVDAIPGARVTILSLPHPGNPTEQQIGDGFVDPHFDRIALSRALHDGETLYAIQHLCGTRSRRLHARQAGPGTMSFLMSPEKKWPVSSEPAVEGVVWRSSRLDCAANGTFAFFGTFENTAKKSSADLDASVNLSLAGGVTFGTTLIAALAGADPEEPGNSVLLAKGYLPFRSEDKNGVTPALGDTAVWKSLLAATANFSWIVALSPISVESEPDDPEEPGDGD